MSALGLCLIPLVLLLSLVEAWLWKSMRRFLATMVKGNFQTNISLVFFFEILVPSRWEFSFFRLRLKDFGIFELEFKTPKSLWELRIWSTLFEEGMARWTSPDWLQIPQMRSTFGDVCARKCKGGRFWPSFIGEIHFKLIRNQYPCSSNKSFISLPETSILHWNNPPLVKSMAFLSAGWGGTGGKTTIQGVAKDFSYLFLMCSWKNKVTLISDHRGPTYKPTPIITSCVIQLMIVLVRSMVLLVLDACGVLGNLMLAFFALRILAFGQDSKLGGIFWIGFGSLPSRGGAWQDSLSSDEIYHTYSLMVWQSICAIFHSGILEFGDREMLFFLLLSSI